MDRILVCLGLTRVTRKDMDPSSLVSSVVNCSWESMELMCSRKRFCVLFFLDDKGITHILSPKSGELEMYWWP